MAWMKNIAGMVNPICNDVKENNEDDNIMKQLKVDVLIEDIDKQLTVYYMSIGLLGVPLMVLNRSRNPLLLIFDNQKSNGYRKSILEKASIRLPECFKYGENDLRDMKIRIKAIKEFVGEYCKRENRAEALKFIFWSLLALAVDRTDYNEKIALIADFAQLLKIDEETLRDIIRVIKVICGEVEACFKLQTSEVRTVFAGVLSLFIK